jgi:Fibronectin type III domain.
MYTDKPGKPEGPLKISDIHKEGCNLKWNAPEDDGGSPIEHYVVEKMDTESGKCVLAKWKQFLHLISQ